MFDGYKRECPRCKAHLREGVLCPACHKVLPRNLSRTRRVLENVSIGDRQAELLQPFVRHGRMDLGCLERCRQTVGADKMFLRNK